MTTFTETTFTEATEDTITIRRATPADGVALDRLAQLDSTVAPERAAVLVAELGNELVAALPLGGGQPIADPFRRTAGVVEMLEARAAELAPARRRPRGRRLFGSLRPAHAGRV
jgi:hypothetical protein